MLNEFVHKILVHEADKSSGERMQKVRIYLNLIGDFSAPVVVIPLTPEEQAEQEKLQIKRAKQREANRRFYAKQKAKREQEQQQAKTA
jgi:hypothetical protein